MSFPNLPPADPQFYRKDESIVATHDGGTGGETPERARNNLGAAPNDAEYLVAMANAELPNAIVTGSFTGLANPSGSIGLTAVNGSASTAARSDGTHALSQAIVPTWTGLHTFNNAAVVKSPNSSVTPLTANGFLGQTAMVQLWQVNGGQIAQMAPDGTLTLSNALAIAGGGGTATVAPVGLTADRTIEIPDADGQMVLYGGGSDPPGAGVIASVNRTLTANVSTPVNLTNTTPAGFYQIFVHMACTVGTGGQTVTTSFTYTSDAGARTKPSSQVVMVAGNYGSGSEVIYLASGNVTWITSGYVSGTYKLRIRAVYLGA